MADIGGTNARFALMAESGDQLLQSREYRCRDFNNIENAIWQYFKDIACEADQLLRFCLAVPGPVDNDQIEFVNNDWSFSQTDLAELFKRPINCINDFDAQAYYVNQIEDHELRWFNDKRPNGGGVKLVLGAGTGLGVSAILPSGELVPSEAGHIAFAPRSESEVVLLQQLWKRFPRVSVERILSGPGLENLYWANHNLCEDILTVPAELSAPEIVLAAQQQEPIALKTINDFFEILASVAGDLTIAMGAFDGVYLSGGVLPRLMSFVDQQSFLARFSDKGRFSDMCAATPVCLVLTEQPGLKGCALA